MDVRVGLQRRLSTEKFIFLNCAVEEDSVCMPSRLDAGYRKLGAGAVG